MQNCDVGTSLMCSNTNRKNNANTKFVPWKFSGTLMGANVGFNYQASRFKKKKKTERDAWVAQSL